MIRRTIALPAALASAALLGGTLALTVPASASTGVYPTPSPTAVPTQPTPTPTAPVVNPFAGCNFTRTLTVTFDPNRQRDVFRVVPSITCDQGGPLRAVRVFLLSGPRF